MINNEWSWLAGAAASQLNSYISIDEINKTDSENKPLNKIDLVDHSPTPEEIVISRDLYDHLSDEAKSIITLLKNLPSELTTITKGQFWNIINPIFKGKSKLKKQVIKELKNYTHLL